MNEDKITLEEFLDDEEVLNEIKNPKNYNKLSTL
jgi:hypothetical protein